MSLRSELKSIAAPIDEELNRINSKIISLQYKLSSVEEEHQDCPSCIENDPNYLKLQKKLDYAYLKRCELYINQKKLSQALDDFLGHLYGKNVSLDFSKKLLTLALDPESRTQDCDKLHLYKENCFFWLQNFQDSILRQQAFWQAIIPGTFLGNLFYIQRGETKPALNRGCLERIAIFLTHELSRSGAVLHLDRYLLTEVAQQVDFQKQLQKYFPMLFNKVMEFIMLHKALLPKHLTPDASHSMDEKKSPEKAGLRFFKIGPKGEEKYVCTSIALPNKESGEELPLQFPRRAPNPAYTGGEQFDENGTVIKLRP